MSSFPQHQENILALQALGFDVSEHFENGEVSLDSWGYDTLTYLLKDVIQELHKRNAAADRIRKLEDFKTYVHKRLDDMGVPHSVPESEHDKAGCRIGGRLDWVEKEGASLAAGTCCHPEEGLSADDGGVIFCKKDRKIAGLLEWAIERWRAEVQYRPLHNKNRRALDDTWRQVIRFAGGDPDALIGPDHDAMIASIS